MEKIINIAIQLSSENVIIPLLYSVQNEDDNENVKLISCKANLPADEIPSWLSPSSFTIRRVYSPESHGDIGVTVTEFGSIPCKNIESAKFVENSYDQISIIERLN